jgi:hypothetical protein
MPVAATMPTTVLRGKAIIATVHQFALNKARADKADADNKLLRDEIIEAMGSETVASCGTHIVRVTETDGTPGTANMTVTKEMIGVVIPGKKGRAGSIKLEVI